jgi:hypothetical protein
MLLHSTASSGEVDPWAGVPWVRQPLPPGRGAIPVPPTAQSQRCADCSGHPPESAVPVAGLGPRRGMSWRGVLPSAQRAESRGSRLPTSRFRCSSRPPRRAPLRRRFSGCGTRSPGVLPSGQRAESRGFRLPTFPFRCSSRPPRRAPLRRGFSGAGMSWRGVLPSGQRAESRGVRLPTSRFRCSSRPPRRAPLRRRFSGAGPVTLPGRKPRARCWIRPVPDSRPPPPLPSA